MPKPRVNVYLYRLFERAFQLALSFPCFMLICCLPCDERFSFLFYWMCTDFFFHRSSGSSAPFPNSCSSSAQEKKRFTGKDIFRDIKDGLCTISGIRKKFSFSPLGGFRVNFSLVAFEFLLPFFHRLHKVKGAMHLIS